MILKFDPSRKKPKTPSFSLYLARAEHLNCLGANDQKVSVDVLTLASQGEWCDYDEGRRIFERGHLRVEFVSELSSSNIERVTLSVSLGKKEVLFLHDNGGEASGFIRRGGWMGEVERLAAKADQETRDEALEYCQDVFFESAARALAKRNVKYMPQKVLLCVRPMELRKRTFSTAPEGPYLPTG